VIDLLN